MDRSTKSTRRPRRLTPRQRLFIRNYKKTLDTRAAAKLSGLSPNYCSELMSKDSDIRRYLYEWEKRQDKRAEISIQDFAEQLFYLATRSAHDYYKRKGKHGKGRLLRPHELSKAAAACVDGIKEVKTVYQDGTERVTFEYKLSPKQSALDLVARHKGLIASIKHEIEGEVKIKLDYDKLYVDPDKIGKGEYLNKQGQKVLLMDPSDYTPVKPELPEGAADYDLDELLEDESDEN